MSYNKIMLNINTLTDKYKTRKLTEEDIDVVLKLYKTNQKYFDYFNDVPTKGTVKEDIYALPKGIELKDKYYLGLFDNDELVGVVDIIDGYPERGTIYFGLLMLDDKYKNQGIGSSIICDFCDELKKQGFKYIKLAYINKSEEANHFWRKNGFVDSGKISNLKKIDITELVRKL